MYVKAHEQSIKTENIPISETNDCVNQVGTFLYVCSALNFYKLQPVRTSNMFSTFDVSCRFSVIMNWIRSQSKDWDQNSHQSIKSKQTQSQGNMGWPSLKPNNLRILEQDTGDVVMARGTRGTQSHDTTSIQNHANDREAAHIDHSSRCWLAEGFVLTPWFCCLIVASLQTSWERSILQPPVVLLWLHSAQQPAGSL